MICRSLPEYSTAASINGCGRTGICRCACGCVRCCVAAHHLRTVAIACLSAYSPYNLALLSKRTLHQGCNNIQVVIISTSEYPLLRIRSRNDTAELKMLSYRFGICCALPTSRKQPVPCGLTIPETRQHVPMFAT